MKSIMKRFLLIIGFWLPYFSFCQIRADSSILQYSYFIYAPDQSGKQICAEATAFFIREGKKLFLITASHVLSGHDPIACQSSKGNWPDSFFVKIDEHLKLPIYSKPFKESICLPYYRSPDLAVIEIANRRKFKKARSIERFLPHENLPTTGRFIFFGFPDNLGEIPKNVTPEANEVMGTAQFKKNPNEPLHYTKENIDDSINYQVTSDYGHGFSGAPVFIVESENGNNHSCSYTFAGVYAEGDPVIHMGSIIRPKVILYKIREVKDKKKERFLW
jgi:hypothetical protein